MDQIPPALQVGSPVVGGSTTSSNTYPAPPRRASVSRNGSFPVVPSQPALFQSATTACGNGSHRQHSYRALANPALGLAYTSSDAPIPLSPFKAIDCDPAAERFLNQSPRLSVKSSRTRSFLNRLGSIRSNRSSRHSKYGVLGDCDEEYGHRKDTTRGLKEADEEDDDGVIACDLSGLEGPIGMRNMHVNNGVRIGAADKEQGIVQAGLAADYERLESQASKRGALGSGMESVIDAPFVGRAQIPIIHGRGPSIVRVDARSAAQKVAEEKGEITVVTGGFVSRKAQL